jgi:phosphoribosylamine--glycine ligase
MKLLIIDIGGCGLDFAIRCQWAGHEVKLYYKPLKHTNVGKGLVQRVAHWQDHMKWADLILMTDLNAYVEELEVYFQKGFPIFGTNRASQQLELDREQGQLLLERCGLDTIPFVKFDNCDDAIAHVLAAGDKRFVSKPCGNMGTSLSYVSKSAADMVFMLQWWKKQGKLKAPFILQEFVSGIEMGVGGWFGPGGFCDVWEENFEHKKLMNGDIGVNTGEMGTAMKYVEDSKLARETLAKCEAALAALRFVGNVDLNVMIDDKGKIWPLEWTMRLGWPAFMIQSSLHKGDPLLWMADLLNGRDTLRVRYDHAIGVVMTIPDFPYSHLTGRDVEGFPIYGINQENIDDVHFNEIMAGSAPCMDGSRVVRDRELFVAAGDNLLTLVGRGGHVESARAKAYGLVKSIEVPNSPMYRTDIGSRLEHQLPELQKHGFATEWSYK